MGSFFYQVNNTIYVKFMHDMTAVQFHCAQSSTKFICDFLVTLSIKNQLQYFFSALVSILAAESAKLL